MVKNIINYFRSLKEKFFSVKYRMITISDSAHNFRVVYPKAHEKLCNFNMKNEILEIMIEEFVEKYPETKREDLRINIL